MMPALGKLARSFLRNKKYKQKVWDMVPVVEDLCTMCKALSLIPHTEKPK
jgi:hypothetical protein